jgi:hypothetical protein
VKAAQDTPKDTKLLLQNFLTGAVSTKHPLVLNLTSTVSDAESDLHTVYRSLVATAEENRGHRSATKLSNRIKFPYSRHSSYGELCQLVSAFKPKDIWPCTVDTMRWVRKGRNVPLILQQLVLTLGLGITIEGLFGDHCSGNVFEHDNYMAELATELHIEDMDQHETQISSQSHIQSSPVLFLSSPVAMISSPYPERDHEPGRQKNESAAQNQAATTSVKHEDHGSRNELDENNSTSQPHQVIDLTLEESESSQNTATQNTRSQVLKRSFDSFSEGSEIVARPRLDGQTLDEDDKHLFDSQDTSISAGALEARRTAFDSVLHAFSSNQWPGLLCTTNNHVHRESELGEDHGSSDMNRAVPEEPAP